MTIVLFLCSLCYYYQLAYSPTLFNALITFVNAGSMSGNLELHFHGLYLTRILKCFLRQHTFQTFCSECCQALKINLRMVLNKDQQELL